MAHDQHLVLGLHQAVEAISRDFGQYGPQLQLYRTLWPLVFGPESYLMHTAGESGVWVKRSAKGPTHPISVQEAGDWIVQRLISRPPDSDHLARICSLVFQAPAKAIQDAGGQVAIQVNTGMDDFACRQCGQCCRQLTYHDGCQLSDYRRWQELGRNDILQWVGVVRQAGQVVGVRIWIRPGSSDYVDGCPWLTPDSQSAKRLCAIHNVRPTICREYPGGRKHARMTGCPGFGR